jgi:hypothetical protein
MTHEAEPAASPTDELAEWDKVLDRADAIRQRQEDVYPQRLWDQLDRIEVIQLEMLEWMGLRPKESGDGVRDLPSGDPGSDGEGSRDSAPAGG